MGKKAWSPADGPGVAPEQLPGGHGHLRGDGTVDGDRPLWAPSEGPARTEPGGPGGEPDGRGPDEGAPPQATTSTNEK
ncbi:MAG: hypothetical protein QM704_19035 [Anaeromyxobacteraceae bacterium]